MMEWDNIQVKFKTVRDYSGRKRINITNSDGLVKDNEVAVMLKSDYEILMTELDRLQELEQNLDNQKVTADAMGDKFLQPVKDSFNDIIDGLKQDLKDKDKEINRLKAVYQDYDKQVYSLGFIDILRHKNRDISDDFNSKIWITSSDDSMVTDAEVMKLNKPDMTGDADSPDSDNGGDDS